LPLGGPLLGSCPLLRGGPLLSTMCVYNGFSREGLCTFLTNSLTKFILAATLVNKCTDAKISTLDATLCMHVVIDLAKYEFL
jgi:hypothetical protein